MGKYARLAASLAFSVLVVSSFAQTDAGGGVAPPPAGGTWQQVTNHASFKAGAAILLSDGTVIVEVPEARTWWKLTPDKTGSYQNGTWSQIASTQSTYGPLYFGSALMPDGKVVIIGGEYNLGSQDWDKQGSIYDPAANTWTALAGPSGWSEIG